MRVTCSGYLLTLAAVSCCYVFGLPTANGANQARTAAKNSRSAPTAHAREESDAVELHAASMAADDFLRGIKLIELPEGKQLLARTQWIVGAADYGRNFYDRPQFTESTTLFEGFFDTDVAGARGYKRLMEMKAVSEAGTPLQTKFLILEFKDKDSQTWKVFSSSTEGMDIEHEVAAAERDLNDTQFTSSKENYDRYGFWLLCAGRLKDAKAALLKARDASPIRGGVSSVVGQTSQHTVLKIAAELEVIKRITDE